MTVEIFTKQEYSLTRLRLDKTINNNQEMYVNVCKKCD